MSTITLDRPTTTSPTVTDPGTDPNTAHPLSDQEADALLMQSASFERTGPISVTRFFHSPRICQ